MKRYYALTALLILMHCSSFGQSADTFRRWRFGVLVGPHFVYQVPKSFDVNQTGGIVAVADIGYALQNSSKGWSVRFQPGITRFRTRQEVGVAGSDNYMLWKWKTTAINAPLLVRYTILEGKVRPFAELGISFMARNFWKLKGRGQTCMNGTCYPNDFDETGGGDIDKGRFSALGGIGVEFDLGKVTIPVTVRWNEQLKKIERINDITTGLNYTLPRTRIIQVTAGITF